MLYFLAASPPISTFIFATQHRMAQSEQENFFDKFLAFSPKILDFIFFFHVITSKFS
jgi:hypothetical protein